MPTNNANLQAELSAVEILKTEQIPSTSCPTCRSGFPDYPETLLVEVVNVEL